MRHALYILVLPVLGACLAPVEGPEEQAAAAACLPTGVTINGPTTTANGLKQWTVTAPSYLEAPAYLYAYVPAQCTGTARCKALYVLPAWQPSHDGIDEAKRLGLAEKYGLILVGPDFPKDAVPGTTGPWYTDCGNNHRYDSYIPEVVVPFVDATLPTLGTSAGRLLVGYSKSGHGAHSLLARHPTVFGRAGSWDGNLDSGNRVDTLCSDTVWNSGYRFPDLYAATASTFAGSGPFRFAIDGYAYFAGSNKAMHDKLVSLGVQSYYPTPVQRSHVWNSGWLAPLVGALAGP